MELKIKDRVVVIGPKGSAQLGQGGEVKSINASPVIEVQLDGEQRPRNFKVSDLQKAGE